MTFDMMELKDEDMIEDMTIWDAEQFLKYAKEAKLCLFT
jgi:peroxiredoxin family protein